MKLNRSMLFIFVIIAVLLGACSFPAGQETGDQQGTDVADVVSEALTQEALEKIAKEDETPVVTETATEQPTNTAVPESPTPEPTPTKTTYRVGPTDFPEDVNPLTGLKLENPEIMNRMPVIVKVPNYPASGRPHGGLSAADIVFETWIGGGANRFLALYYGQDSDNIWPVRSVRIVDPEIAKLYHAVIAFSGGDPVKVLPKVLEIMGNEIVMEGVCPGICDNGRGDVTRLYADSAAITEYFQSRNIDPGEKPVLDGMLFTEDAPEGGKEASKATFYYSHLNVGEWVYDEESGKYLRWIEDGYTYEMIPLLDKNTKEQLAFSNFIMLFTPNVEIETQLIDIKIWGNYSGRRAVIFRDGKAYEAIWKTMDRKSPIQFYDTEGNPFPLKPGNTWIGITGELTPETVEGTEWRYEFRMP